MWMLLWCVLAVGGGLGRVEGAELASSPAAVAVVAIGALKTRRRAAANRPHAAPWAPSLMAAPHAHLVDARADALGEVVVVERARVRARLDERLVHDAVDLISGHARLGRAVRRVERLAAGAARRADAGDLLRRALDDCLWVVVAAAAACLGEGVDDDVEVRGDGSQSSRHPLANQLPDKSAAIEASLEPSALSSPPSPAPQQQRARAMRPTPPPLPPADAHRCAAAGSPPPTPAARRPRSPAA